MTSQGERWLSSDQSSLGSSYSELEFKEEQTSIIDPYQYEPEDNTSSGDDTATEESPDVGEAQCSILNRMVLIFFMQL